MSCFPAFIQDLQQIVLSFRLIIEMMDGIGIVPENAEVFRCRLQIRESLHGLFRIGIALRIRIFRNAPDSLDRGIVIDIFFNHGRSYRYCNAVSFFQISA